MIGACFFISVAVGSLLLGGLLDKHGRKNVLLVSSLITPLVLFFWLSAPQFTLTHIYVGVSLLGLAASLRASGSYIYATESLLSQHKLQYAVYVFGFDGFCTATTSILFWSGMLTWRSYCLFSGSLMTLILALFWYRLPESPSYLYEKGKFEELTKSLERIA